MSNTAFGADLAFASDSSALIGVRRDGEHYAVIALAERRPSKGNPLKPKSVVDDFAAIVLEHGARELCADAHYRESAKEHLAPHRIAFIDAPPGRDGKAESYLLTKKLLHEQRLAIPNHARLVAQLRAVVSKPMPGGGIAISSPRRAGGGHGDLVSALVLACWRASQVSGSGIQLSTSLRARRELGISTSHRDYRLGTGRGF